MLLGKARYFDRRFIPALEAFNYLLEGYFGKEKVYFEGKLWRENQPAHGEQCVGDRQPKPMAKSIPFGGPLYADVNATVAQAYLNLKITILRRISLRQPWQKKPSN